MNEDVVRRSVVLAARGAAVWIATADGAGSPHLTRAEGLRAGMEASQIFARYWFCPHTLENLEVNARVALVVWDEREGEGYQLLGRARPMEPTAMLDGYGPDEAEGGPQVEWELRIDVDEALDCCRAPHACREAT